MMLSVGFLETLSKVNKGFRERYLSTENDERNSLLFKS
jgi:hypothetical protein